ncbi:MAG TPA: hypothetical protein EYQ24_14930 [Bacteroidetes bacterium]|nr:hypothetical protein [Bacteroidota bacterium]HIL56608.1 hypothetical protein [Rhodothermales bacterium]
MADRPVCSCGHDRYHHWTRAELKFGGGGWFAILNGASGTPKQITFKCGRCGESFETTRDPVVLGEFRRYPYITRSPETQ